MEYTEDNPKPKRGRPSKKELRKIDAANRTVKSARLHIAVVERAENYAKRNRDEQREGPRNFSKLVEDALLFYLDEMDARERIGRDGQDHFTESGYKIPGS